MQRRQFLKLAGGGIVLAAAAGTLGGCSMFEVPASAVAAWQGPDKDVELRHWILSYALLAPNPHNRQPWIADLRTEGQIALRLDTDRLLPATDPFGRQILMGAGAFLELLVMAAAERGYRAEVRLFPDGEPGEKLDAKDFARVQLTKEEGIARDPLFAHVLARRTERRAYDVSRPISAEESGRLSAVASSQPVTFGIAGTLAAPAADAERIVRIRSIAREAWRIELSTEPTMMESMRLLRLGGAEIDRYRDGITITSPLLVILAKTGLFDRNQFPASDSQATQGQIRDFDAITASTPSYLWIVTRGNRREQQIAAGRAYVRVNLAGTAMGLVMHPNEQSLQEFKEVAGPYRDIHTLLEAPAPDYTVQMLARLGRLPAGSDPAPPAPRRGLSAHLAA
ncbi:MAG: hypothetical protein JNM42_00845 [Propionivibrio sp.]|uniref:Acg family FMN-binding oxidoreductase n=1 Tax=Propionivibrio sp. TaxID=2212460 RepID=UPI001A63BE00|nr:hypothetical protein [Propionivibrio sp.]MBL8412969.1 hypothetical protein [Propionivibrio sp.]